MKIRQVLLGAVLASFLNVASADLTPWTDYDIGTEVMSVTTVKVDSNMIDKYLEGLSQTWVTGNDIAVELGEMESYAIYVSQLPASGEFNVVLVVRFEDLSSFEPSQKRFDTFMKKWSDENKAASDVIVQTYPGIREITGEYLLREIKLK